MNCRYAWMLRPQERLFDSLIFGMGDKLNIKLIRIGLPKRKYK